MYCKNLLKRHRQTKIVFFCKKNKRYIDIWQECENCRDFILVKNKPIKKVSNKRITVTKETYNKVMQRDKGRCVMFNYECEGKIELHHVRYRSERKDLINEPNNCVCLCTFHHQLVHSNKKKYQPILLKMLENK